ncbi:WLM domain-containing protein [Podospora conica]|nr:WLM domain-containing protein [Schizothecium conicum]
MPELDALVRNYSHLKDFSRHQDALLTLKKIASVVKPIMRARGWKVGELAEFYPDQANLLGLNVNRGQRILLRLRYPGDKNQFLPIDEVTDTMLHELCHIVHGPHDGKFHALWDQLRDEHEGLLMKGYTGEGFLSDGHRLGGRGQVPMDEARRLARAAAEKRKVLAAGSGRKLGGAAPRPSQDIRSVILSAIERRNQSLEGCGNTKHNEREILEISDEASANGFRTKAEEDAANEAAIAQALWELAQEDDMAKYGSSYIPPTAENPTGNGGGTVFGGAQKGKSPWTESLGARSKPSKASSPPPIPVATKPAIPENASEVEVWACEACTLHNPSSYLACDACGNQRPQRVGRGLAAASVAGSSKGNSSNKNGGSSSSSSNNKRPRAVIDLTSSPVKGSSTKKRVGSATTTQQPSAPVPSTWECTFCGNTMLREWWTCSMCGKMKTSSK